MSTKQKYLSQFRHSLAYAPIHLYTELQEDGTEVLRHIRVQNHTYEVPPEGITIDTLPDDSIEGHHIKDGTVEKKDMSSQLQGELLTVAEKGTVGGLATLGNDGKVPTEQLPETPVATEADVRSIVSDYGE